MSRTILSHMRRQAVAYLALFVALGGTSYAAAQLPKNSVGPKQIKKNGVGSSEIKKNAVTSAKVKNKSLKAADFATGQLPAGPQGPPGPSTGAAGGDLTGNYPNPSIKPNGVDSGKIADGSVTTSDLNATDVRISLDFASFANKQCYERTANVPGARVGDVVMVNVPSSFNDQVSVSPLGVDAANVVTIRFCVSPNATTPTPDTPAGDWRFVLIH